LVPLVPLVTFGDFGAIGDIGDGDIGDIGDICDIICDICDICDISLERRVNLGTEITHPATSPAAHFFLLFHFSELLIFIGEM